MKFALPHSRDDLSNVLADGCAKGGEALEPGDADMTLSNLAVEVLRHGLDRALPQNGSWIDALARGITAWAQRAEIASWHLLVS